MISRLAVSLGVLVSLAAGAPQSQPVPKGRAPKPMFSQAYVDALKDILELEPGDVAKLENRLARNPDDFAARLKLMAYSMRADRTGLEESRARRAELTLWLVEHQPDSEILGSPYAAFGPGELKPDQVLRATRLWRAAIAAHPSNARVFRNAANFYQQQDRGVFVEYLEKAVALAPDVKHYSRQLGMFYAGVILTMTAGSAYRDPAGANPELSRHAIHELDTTGNAQLLEPAVWLFQSEYNRSLMMGRGNRSVGDLAERYFRRAKTLDPDMDEAWVFPKLDPKMVGMLAPGARPPEDPQARFEAAAKQIRRLAPSAFPELPPAVAKVLRSRGCLIPQPAPDGPPRNVIRGEFFEKGQSDWAVLCSIGRSSSILAFRSNNETHPEELAKAEDKTYLEDVGGRSIAYSRQISAVDRKFIIGHYRAYGGPEPPPIGHQGIDDAFLGKASVAYYRYRGEWRRLTGSD